MREKENRPGANGAAVGIGAQGSASINMKYTTEVEVPSMPQCIEAEEALLGGCMSTIFEGIFDSVRDKLRASDFHDPRNALSWAAMQRIADRGDPVDRITVKNELERSGRYEDAGGFEHLKRLSDQSFFAGGAERYTGMILRASQQRRLISAGVRLVQQAYQSDANPDEVIEDAQQVLRTVQDAAKATEAKRRYTLHSAAEAFEPIQPLEQLVQDVITRPSVNVPYGPPGSLKTWLMMDLAVRISVGLDWLGRPTKQGPVLWIDEESGDRRFKWRLRQLLDGLDIQTPPPITYTTLEMFNLRDPMDVAHVGEIVDQVKPAAVFIDALVDVMPGGDENAVKDVQPLFLHLRSLAEKHDVAIIVIHHSNKIGGYRGSTAIPGGVELMLEVAAADPDPNNPGLRRVSLAVRKARDVEESKLAAEVNFGILKVQVTEAKTIVPRPPQFSQGEKYVLRYLEAAGVPVSVKELMDHAEGCSPRTARDSVYKLTNRGMARRCNVGGQGTDAEYELVRRSDATEPELGNVDEEIPF